MESVVGMTMFLQQWFWYPLAHFLSLSFTSTAFIGVNHDLKVDTLLPDDE
jgi:26S proteasome regulatory subunit N2